MLYIVCIRMVPLAISTMILRIRIPTGNSPDVGSYRNAHQVESDGNVNIYWRVTDSYGNILYSKYK